MIGSGYERRSETSSSSSSGHDDAAAAPRVRVYEMAKELGLANRDLVGKIRALGIDVANHIATSRRPTSIASGAARWTANGRRAWSRSDSTDTVIRCRSKSAPPPPRVRLQRLLPPLLPPALPRRWFCQRTCA